MNNSQYYANKITERTRSPRISPKNARREINVKTSGVVKFREDTLSSPSSERSDAGYRRSSKKEQGGRQTMSGSKKRGSPEPVKL